MDRWDNDSRLAQEIVGHKWYIRENDSGTWPIGYKVYTVLKQKVMYPGFRPVVGSLILVEQAACFIPWKGQGRRVGNSFQDSNESYDFDMCNPEFPDNLREKITEIIEPKKESEPFTCLLAIAAWATLITMMLYLLLE